MMNEIIIKFFLFERRGMAKRRLLLRGIIYLRLYIDGVEIRYGISLLPHLKIKIHTNMHWKLT